MDFNQSVEEWAFWVIHGGYASTSEIVKIHGEEWNWKGECSNKKTGAVLVNDDEMKLMHRAFVYCLTKKQQETLIIEYGLLPWVPPMTSQFRRSEFCGLSQGTYRKRLHDAKVSLSRHYQKLSVQRDHDIDRA